MDPSTKPATSLFQVYLRLRPPPGGPTASTVSGGSERFLDVEEPEDDDGPPTHITLNPPNDRRRAIEKFAFTQVFEEDASQLEIFHCTRVASLVEGVLAPHGGMGTDGLLATLGVTGSGKTHTMLGSRSQRGLTQLALDVVFRSLGNNLVDYDQQPGLEQSLQTCDASEASLATASAFLDTVYADPLAQSRGGASSRAATPMIVGCPVSPLQSVSTRLFYTPGADPEMVPRSLRLVREAARQELRGSTVYGPNAESRAHEEKNISRSPVKKKMDTPSSKRVLRPTRSYMTLTATAASRVRTIAKTDEKGDHYPPSTPRRAMQPPTTFPQHPDVTSVNVSSDPSCEYAVVISMYEVYNDRIFDLLTPPIKSHATKEYRRRPLLFKSTELSPDRKVVAGLRKVICGSLHEALMVLEAGLHERRVAGTGSNSVSSRSHGFFCVEVRKRTRSRRSTVWGGNVLTIVDLAGSERARDAKTQGATLAEAGKINESLMYLGQCLQMQSDSSGSNRPGVVPFRQCKLTELLFSNSFPSASSHAQSSARRNPQRAVMIVTADPIGDFNATSQILRYSALAREVTVPRIPSIFSNPPAAAPPSHNPCSSPMSPTGAPSRPIFSSYNSSNGTGFRSGSQRAISAYSESDRETMELAALEIARITAESESLRIELARESEARMVAEAHLLSMEDRMLELEQCIREECVAEFENRLALELARWKANLALEQERNEEHWDRKMEVFERGIANTDFDETDNKENVLVENLEEENERLRRELVILKRELMVRSPTKRMPLQERDDFAQVGMAGTPTGFSPSNSRSGSPCAGTPVAPAEVGNLGRKLERMRVSQDGGVSLNPGSPRKVRRGGRRVEDDE